VHTIKFVNLAKYQYVLTNNKIKFGDFHALMPALFGKAAHDPDAAQDQERIQGASWVQPRAPARWAYEPPSSGTARPEELSPFRPGGGLAAARHPFDIAAGVEAASLRSTASGGRWHRWQRRGFGGRGGFPTCHFPIPSLHIKAHSH
jgi:hypothetical protein